MTAASQSHPTSFATTTLLILGCGGHARTVAATALSLGYARILMVDPNARPEERHFGCDVIRPEEVKVVPTMTGIPASGDPELRKQQMAWLEEHQVPVTTVVSPHAVLGPDVTLDKGGFVGAGAYVGPQAQVGTGCIINTGAVLEHDACAGAFSHVSVHATVAGYSRIGSMCMIGAGAILIDRVRIPDWTIIGAGATVIRDLSEAGTYVGCPARLVTPHTP